jgi:hypothetical protein
MGSIVAIYTLSLFALQLQESNLLLGCWVWPAAATERRLAQRLAARHHFWSVVALECLGLLDMERLEVLLPGIGFEPGTSPT